MLDRLRHATDLTKFKADQLLRVNRVQGEIGTIRREIQLTRDQIAGAALELHRAQSPLPEAIEQLCIAVDRLNAQIMEREGIIAAIQAEPPPQMNATSTTPQPMHYAASVQSAATAIARPAQACPHCGFGAPLQATFCPNCGKPLPKPSAPAESPMAESQTDSDTLSDDTSDTSDTSDIPKNQGDSGG